jgi:hypothetical protein
LDALVCIQLDAIPIPTEAGGQAKLQIATLSLLLNCLP